MKKYDYSFFESSIQNVRTFIGRQPSALQQGALETGSEEQLKRSPKILIEGDEMGDDCIFEAASYATTPGRGLRLVAEVVGHTLPEDFLQFYELYEKALVVTRTFPLHLWSEAKIIEGIERFRENSDKPFRVFRFADQYDREATQFGLRLDDPEKMKWQVISTAIGCIDDMDDDSIDPRQVIGESFHGWLKSWIERDGLPDGFMELGPEGGYIDPPSDEDWARVRGRQGLE